MLERVKGKTNLADLLLLLKFAGLWFNFKRDDHVVLQKLRYIYFLVVFVIMNISVTKDGIKSALSNRSFFMVSGGYYVTIQVVIYYLYRDKTRDILEKLKRLQKQQTEEWQRDMFAKQSSIVWAAMWFYGILASTFLLLYYTAPFFYDLCLLMFNATGDDGDIFSFPYPLDEIRKNSRDFLHYTLQLMSLIWSMFLISYGMGSLGLQIIICSYCCIEIRILRRILESGGQQKLLNNKRFLKKIITRHNDILSVIADAKAVIGPAVAIQIALGAILLSAFLFSIMEMEDSLSLTITYILLFSVMASLNFTFCFFGEMLETQGNKLFECLCGIPWDEMTPQTRKDFNLILLQAGRPIQISYQGLLPVNFQSFQFVMNSSYSFLMLLSSTK